MNKCFLINIFVVLLQILSVISEESENSKIFTNIYKKEIFGQGSGWGSHFNNSREYRKVLQKYFYDPRFTKIVDYGCGDFQMMKYINIPDNKTYVGVDVVEYVINDNIKLYAKDNVKFYTIDDFSNKKDQKLLSGDLLIVKDVFTLWTNYKVKKFLDTIPPRFKYGLFTHETLTKGQKNNDIKKIGTLHVADIHKPPFNFKNIVKVMEYPILVNNKPTQRVKRIDFYTNPNPKFIPASTS